MARAMPTRCFMPPDSSLGKASWCPPRPTVSMERATRSGASSGRHVEPGEGHLDVLPHGEPGKQSEVLKDERDSRVQPLQRFAVRQDFAPRRPDQPDHHPHERALAAAAGAENGQNFVRAPRRATRPAG